MVGEPRGELALRRADLVDRREELEELDRRLRWAYLPAGLIGGMVAGITHVTLGEPLITWAVAGNTLFIFMGIRVTRGKNREEIETVDTELDELDAGS